MTGEFVIHISTLSCQDSECFFHALFPIWVLDFFLIEPMVESGLDETFSFFFHKSKEYFECISSSSFLEPSI